MKSATEQFRVAIERAGFERLTGLAGKLLARLRRWRQLSYERKLLASLDSRMLRDIGISRAEAERESARPFWDEPDVAQRHEQRS